MIFIASPYTDPEPEVMTARAAVARELVAHMTRQGLYVYSPIVHFHGVAVVHSLPREYAFWQGHSRIMIERADGFAILAIPGWRESVGLKDEEIIARARGLPVSYWWKYSGKWRTNVEPPHG